MLTDEVIDRVRDALPDGWSVRRERADAVRVNAGQAYARVFSLGPNDAGANPEELVDAFVDTIGRFARDREARG